MYCAGAGDMKPFHHMGPLKKTRSLLEKDARSFETFIRMCVQVVYLALGRRYFNQIGDLYFLLLTYIDKNLNELYVT